MPSEIRKVQPNFQARDPFEWAGSMEGVPEWVDPLEAPGARPWRRTAHERFEALAPLLPGVVLTAVLALVGAGIATAVGEHWLGFAKSPISPIWVTILAGLVLRNAIGLPSAYLPGIGLCVQRVLRIGIVLLGARLSLAGALELGALALPLVTVTISCGLLGVMLLAHWARIERRLAALIAVGTAICGNSAVVAMAPVIDAEQDEVSYAVGSVTLFGLLALLSYPVLAHVGFGGDPHAAGLFFGSAIHDTAQAVGAALLSQQLYGASEVLDAALVTKLLRNVSMVLVIPGMALFFRRATGKAGASMPLGASLRRAVPMFVIAFAGMVVLRTVGDMGDEAFGFFTPGQWDDLISFCTTVSTGCMMVAMAGVGLGTDLRRLKQRGLKPLGVGLFAAALVGGVSASLITWWAI